MKPSRLKNMKWMTAGAVGVLVLASSVLNAQPPVGGGSGARSSAPNRSSYGISAGGSAGGGAGGLGVGAGAGDGPGDEGGGGGRADIDGFGEV